MNKRVPIVAGNWKMFKRYSEALDLARRVRYGLGSERWCEVVLCPPFPYLIPIKEILKDSQIKLGAQNMHYEDEGPYTGEVSAKMLLTSGVQFVILGHSERREHFDETDEIVNLKIKRALYSGLIPIVCVGERLEERKAGKMLEVVSSQLEGCFKGIELKDGAQVVIAYEPVWAIGTGVNATPKEAQEAQNFIRVWLKNRYGENVGDCVRILYGGSLKPENAGEIFSMDDVDGGLVGGASLEAESFIKIVLAAKDVKC